MSTKFRLGLTGGIGSGKTTVANFFAELGASIIDTDAIAHQLTAANGDAIPIIELVFGAAAIQADGALNRSYMRDLIFQDASKKKQLETILHPLIRLEAERQALLTQGNYLIFVVPLLFESGNWQSRVDQIAVVDCHVETQIQRVIQRNGLARAQVEAIIKSQATRSNRLAIADVVIDSEQSLIQLKKQVTTLHQVYLKIAKAKASS
jgi:dephospho-CoA kinase